MRKLGLFLPIGALLIGLNLFEDPANLFRGQGYEQEIAEILLRGENVANVDDYDDRLVQRDFITGLREARQIVVFGSSRSMKVGSYLFPDQSFFNHGVSGATLEDYIAILELYHKRGLKPAVIILGLDPWILNANNNQVRWKSIRSDYAAGANRLGFEVHTDWEDSIGISDKFVQVVSPSYFQASFAKFQARLSSAIADDDCYATPESLAEVMVKLHDGSLSYGNAFRNRTPDQVREDALAYARHVPVYSLGKFHGLDPALRDQFERFVALLLQENIQCVFFLPPYHPDTYRRIAAAEEYKIITEAQRYFEEFAARHQIDVVGSYNPLDCACGAGEFYDAMHPRESCLSKIFANRRPHPESVPSPLDPNAVRQ